MEVMSRVAGHDKNIRSRRFEPMRRSADKRHGGFAAVKNGVGTVGDGGVVVDEDVYMLTVGVGVGQGHELAEKIGGRHGPHTADDPDNFFAVYH